MDLRLDRASGLPVGAQLENRLRAAVETGRLAPGDQLPSLRQVAAQAAVNVNTVRAVYARLEATGVITTEQGRGTFVTSARVDDRRTLREQIARLEAELVRLPSPRGPAGPAPTAAAAPAGLLSTTELATIRDDLFTRLQELDAARAEVIQRLARLDETAEPVARRRSSATLSGARVRWVGA